MNGGYVMIDMQNAVYDSGKSIKIDGIYKLFDDAVKKQKPIILYNYWWDDRKINTPFFASCMMVEAADNLYYVHPMASNRDFYVGYDDYVIFE